MQELKELMNQARTESVIAHSIDRLTGYSEFDNTIERLEKRGFVDGFESGAIAGFAHAIQLLKDEGFTEHAHVLETQSEGVATSLSEWDDIDGIDAITLTDLEPSGGYELATIKNGQRFARKYLGYSAEESVRMFINQLQKG